MSNATRFQVNLPNGGTSAPNGDARLPRTAEGAQAALGAGEATLVIPLTLHVSIGLGAATPADTKPTVHSVSSPSEIGAEATFQQPKYDPDYENRRGFDVHYLGVELPLPEPKDKSIVSKLDDGSHVIPYEHFSVVMNKKRRLALFTASNVDGRAKVRRPTSDDDYSRKGLTGLDKNAQEMWITDPRIPEQHQLPDVFYTRDGGAFDKGHIVRREDVCWGRSHDQIVRANGDTFHTTNCSPQIAAYNRSNLQGLWGRLENEIQAQDRREPFSIFAGPVLAADDPWFEGRDERGTVKIQIPRAYWKVVVCKGEGGGLQAFGFVLEQDLRAVPLEEAFRVDEEWIPHMRPIAEIEEMLDLTFPDVLKEADQHDTPGGEEVARKTGARRKPR